LAARDPVPAVWRAGPAALSCRARPRPARSLWVGLWPADDAGRPGTAGLAAPVSGTPARRGHAGPGDPGVRPGPAGFRELLGLSARSPGGHLLLARSAGGRSQAALVGAFPAAGRLNPDGRPCPAGPLPFRRVSAPEGWGMDVQIEVRGWIGCSPAVCASGVVRPPRAGDSRRTSG